MGKAFIASKLTEIATTFRIATMFVHYTYMFMQPPFFFCFTFYEKKCCNISNIFFGHLSSLIISGPRLRGASVVLLNDFVCPVNRKLSYNTLFMTTADSNM
jgi:hypothetical protein